MLWPNCEPSVLGQKGICLGGLLRQRPTSGPQSGAHGVSQLVDAVLHPPAGLVVEQDVLGLCARGLLTALQVSASFWSLKVQSGCGR